MVVTKNLLVAVLALGGVLGLGLWATMTLPQPSASTAAASRLQPGMYSAPTVGQIVETVVSYAEGNHPDDSLVEVESGVWIKASNYHGVTVNGTVYYYSLSPHQSFDPLSRGAVGPDHIEIVAEIRDGGIAILVYTLRHSERETTAM